MEYHKLIADAGIRFSASPVVLSPQLEDLYESHLRKPLASDKSDFRIILTVEGFELNEVKILLESNRLSIAMIKWKDKTVPANFESQAKLVSGDLIYFYQIPENIKKNSLCALWTDDNFLIVQSRRSYNIPNSKDEWILPIRVSEVLKPSLDTKIVREMMITIQKELNAVREFIDNNTEVLPELDVLEMNGGLPNKDSYEVTKEWMSRIKAFGEKLCEIEEKDSK